MIEVPMGQLVAMRRARRDGGALICLLVGAALLLAAFTDAATAQTRRSEARPRAGAQDDILVTEVHIAVIKYALKLQPAQEAFWAPVEIALRELAQMQAGRSDTASSDRSSNRGMTRSAVMRRLKKIATIAAPLLKSLDDEQRHNLAVLAQLAGLQQLLAAR